jgi:phosphoglycerol transferase MdoB-like AlkP superfamily enzyme
MISKMAIALLVFTICRLLFFAFNHSYFSGLKLIHLWGGLRFDWSAVSMLYAPFFLLLLVDFRPKSKLRKVFFHFSNSLAIAFNTIDFEYFKFTQKRTTADLFNNTGLEDDLVKLLPTFAIDYWYVVLISVLLIAFSEWLYRLSEIESYQAPKFLYYWVFLVPTLLFYVISFRGGLQLRPLNAVQASQYAQAKDIALVLNTPFTLLKSAFKEDLEQKAYFSSTDLKKRYSPKIELSSSHDFRAMNVVLIIAESFSKEYIGAYNKGDGYTPFLDSLMQVSLVFDNAYANGKKSIEALPAILAGIPTLMNTAYVSSKYGSNQIEGLGTQLSKKGYRTVFYHGGENGTMGFNAFARLAGIQEYKGKNEYPHKGDYDGNWGIYDQPFLQFCAQDLNAGKQPFFATIFTLSSHHPYTIPVQYSGQFKEGPLPILKSVGYADFALKQFFETAQKSEWFENTLFVITADHTSQTFRESYNSRLGIYAIPIVFYHSKMGKGKRSHKLIQQNDLYPSILDYLNWKGEIVSFGGSTFNEKHEGFVVNYLNGLYQYVKGDYVLHFDGEESVALFQHKQDPQLERNLLGQYTQVRSEMEESLKALLQQYQIALIENKLVP